MMRLRQVVTTRAPSNVGALQSELCFPRVMKNIKFDNFTRMMCSSWADDSFWTCYTELGYDRTKLDIACLFWFQ